MNGPVRVKLTADKNLRADGRPALTRIQADWGHGLVDTDPTNLDPRLSGTSLNRVLLWLVERGYHPKQAESRTQITYNFQDDTHA